MGNDTLYTQTTIDGVSPSSTENSNLIGKWAGLGTFNVLTMLADGLSAGARCCFNYIKVNGAILVDSGPTWNTSQIWSDDISPTDALIDGSLVATYDGNLSTYSTFEGSREITLLSNQNLSASSLRINSDIGAAVVKVNCSVCTPFSYAHLTLRPSRYLCV